MSSYQSEITKEMQQNMLKELNSNGAINHIQVLYLSELLQAIVKSNNRRLKPAIKPKIDKANAIALDLVVNYLQNHPNLEKSLIAVQTEIKESPENDLSSQGHSGDLGFIENTRLVSDLLDWNRIRLEEIREKEEQERLKKEEEELKRQEEDEMNIFARSVTGDFGNTLRERMIAASVIAGREQYSPLGSPRKRAMAEARSEYIPRNDQSFRFIKKPLASMLPEGSHSPKSPKHQNWKPFIQVTNSIAGTSVYGPLSVRGAPSVVSAQTELPQRTQRVIASSERPRSERPPNIKTDRHSQGSAGGSPINSPLAEEENEN